AGRGAAVTQELQQEGFHRDLLVKVDLGETGEWAAGCSVVARTHLPPGIYVDPYELASLQQHNLTKAVLIPDVVDVEAPEYSATGLVVLLYLERDPRCLRCFRGALPVHVRYHRPAGDGEEALVALKSPEVLVCCCDGEICLLHVLELSASQRSQIVVSHGENWLLSDLQNAHSESVSVQCCIMYMSSLASLE
uniref:Phosphatidylinositol-glycan biosynthesis class X protein n=1 Tax=Anser brachyrhynchus TaxID=132585 RepID=A0A8B9IBI9_9AVES